MGQLLAGAPFSWSAVCGCSVQVSIAPEHEGRSRVRLISALEQGQPGVYAIARYPEHCAEAIGIVDSRNSYAAGSIEAAIGVQRSLILVSLLSEGKPPNCLQGHVSFNDLTNAISACTSVSVSFEPNFGISPFLPFLIREAMRASDLVMPCKSGPSSPRASLPWQ